MPLHAGKLKRIIGEQRRNERLSSSDDEAKEDRKGQMEQIVKE